MESLSTPTRADHEQIRRKYVSLAWQLWHEQYNVNFFVWSPIPEDLLRTEVVLFWRGEISEVHGWTDIIGQILKPILDAVNGIFTWFWTNVIRPGIEILTYAIKWVVDGILGVVTAIQSVLGAVWTAVSQGIASLLSRIGEGLAWLGGELTKATAWIWQQLQGFFSAIGEVLKQIGTWIITAIRTYVVDPILAGLSAIFEAIRGLISGIWTFITSGAITHSPVEWRGSYMRWFGIISGVSVLAMSGFIAAAIADVIHPFKDTRMKEVAEFAMRFSGMPFLQAAFFTTYFEIACAKPIRQELNNIFAPEIPGAQDLIRFVVREVLPPDEFNIALSLQGFSAFWSKCYWDAHWILPPPERTRTAFLRKQIKEEEYRKFLIWYDFKPELRPGISVSDVDIMLKTQYEWPGRIDIRWLLEWGEVTPEQGVELTRNVGFDPDWAPRLIRVWLLNQVREELGKVRTVYERALREGFLNPVSFAEKLVGIHYAPHVINALKIWADEELALAEKLELAGEYESLAKGGIITPSEYGQALRELTMVEERITRKVKYMERLLAVKAVKAKAKTKAAT